MTKPPFPMPTVGLLQQWARSAPPPPPWLRAELCNRLVLLLNHVLQQEPQAMDRLRRQQGKHVQVCWGEQALVLQATAAGLLALAQPSSTPDLKLTFLQASPLALARQVLAGERPAVDIRGDVQLAAEVAWLVDNVRWDMEEDLSRLFGDATAHALVTQARALLPVLKGWLAQAAGKAQQARERMAGLRPGAEPEPKAGA